MGDLLTIKDIRENLLPVFEKYEDQIIFSYLFGSILKEDLYQKNDIDIAIFIKPSYSQSYFELKISIYADICRALKMKNVDLVILNLMNNIMLLDEIVRNGIILIDNDKDVREEYELKIIHQAIDFKRQRFLLIGV